MPDLYKLCRQARHEGRKLLSVYLTVGFPTPEWTEPLAQAILESGADIIELGLPFSDPLADGPTIQNAGAVAIRAGATRRHAWNTSMSLNGGGCVVVMGYLNNLLTDGVESLVSRCRDSNVQALIIPDLPIDEEPDLWEVTKRDRVPLIPFVAPTTPIERMQEIDHIGAPFIYAVSVAGVTGMRRNLEDHTATYLDIVRENVKTPILAGFGISGADTARQMARHADGVIVGSAIIERIQKAPSLSSAVKEVKALVCELRHALDTNLD